jgi:putative transcriptional regulator
MIYCNLPELMAKKGVSIEKLSQATGIHELELDRLYNQKAKVMLNAHIVALCMFFDCDIKDLLVRRDKHEV